MLSIFVYHKNITTVLSIFVYFLQYKFLLFFHDSTLSILALHSQERKWTMFSTVFLVIISSFTLSIFIVFTNKQISTDRINENEWNSTFIYWDFICLIWQRFLVSWSRGKDMVHCFSRQNVKYFIIYNKFIKANQSHLIWKLLLIQWNMLV